MTATPAANHRASLLAGLRTGGVRSASANLPHTAAPGATFNLPRITTQQYPHFPEEDEEQLSDYPPQAGFPNHLQGRRPMALTAAVDGPNNRFAQQQTQRDMIPYPPNVMLQNAQVQAQAQTQALQMRMMQLEIMRIQTIQAQQYQAELIAQAQRQQQQQQQQQQQLINQNRRASTQLVPPATAAPTTSTFDIRSAALSAQLRRNAPDQNRQQLGAPVDDQVPMTAALGGKFGSRSASITIPNYINRYAGDSQDDLPPPTPSHTTVISGGTSLGNPASNNISNSTPSKSDTATSWRRGGNNNSVLSGNNRNTTSPSVKITPPPGERVSPPPGAAAANAKRPQPLRFTVVAPVAIEISSDSVDNEDAASSASGGSNSSPSTPRSTSSQDTPLSPREEATKKLYEGLGLGRPNVTADVAPPQSAVPGHRMVSQPTRQPRGPPSGADELGPKNFARMGRRGAVGGLGVLASARERREAVEAY